MILQSILRRVVGYVLMNISPSNIFPTMLLFARFHQNCLSFFHSCELQWVKDVLYPLCIHILTSPHCRVNEGKVKVTGLSPGRGISLQELKDQDRKAIFTVQKAVNPYFARNILDVGLFHELLSTEVLISHPFK